VDLGLAEGGATALAAIGFGETNFGAAVRAGPGAADDGAATVEAIGLGGTSFGFAAIRTGPGAWGGAATGLGDPKADRAKAGSVGAGAREGGAGATGFGPRAVLAGEWLATALFDFEAAGLGATVALAGMVHLAPLLIIRLGGL
jgi:hypothetical protein